MNAQKQAQDEKLYAEMTKTIPFQRLTDVNIFRQFCQMAYDYVSEVFIDLDLLSDLDVFMQQVKDGKHEAFRIRLAVMYDGKVPTEWWVTNMICELNMASFKYPDNCFHIQY